MHSPEVSPRRAASPIAALLAAAVRAIHVPARRGRRQSWEEIKVRKGERHPAVVLDNLVCDYADAGVPLEETRMIARALDLGIRRVYSAVPNLRDVRALLVRETECQSRCDAAQMLAMRPEDCTDAQLESLAARLYEHAQASTEAAAGIEAFLLDRETTREAARRRMAA